jgi:hypothetical protein
MGSAADLPFVFCLIIMKKFPVTIFDNFYENPDLVRDYALSLDYKPSEGGNWPGVRTKDLGLLNQRFFKMFVDKILSLFFDLENSAIEWEVDTYFQKVNSFSSNKFDIKNDGWIHADLDSTVSGVIYLNPYPKPNWGTSIYKLKPNEEYNQYQDSKLLHYSNSKDFNELEYANEKRCSNNKFIESIRVENLYNRLILFEGNEFHGVPSFYSDGNDPRLTQVFFITKINSSSQFPIIRSKLIGCE